MSDAKTTEEPSIEEILGSIRRIIADDDDAPQAAPSASSSSFSAALSAVDSHSSLDEEDDEPLELTQKIDEDGTIIDMNHDADEPEEERYTETPAPVFSTAPNPYAQSTEDEIIMLDEPEDTHTSSSDPLVSQTATAATAAIMSKLARSTNINRSGNDGVTLEDMVKDMVRPMLREWLDQHLPELVQSMVERELERIARRVG